MVRRLETTAPRGHNNRDVFDIILRDMKARHPGTGQVVDFTRSPSS